MSKWTEIRDNIVDALHVDKVTEELKQRVTAAIINEVLPPIEDAAISSSRRSRRSPRRSEAGATGAMPLCCRRSCRARCGWSRWC